MLPLQSPDQIDVTVACLLVVWHNTTIADEGVYVEDLEEEVLDLVDHLDVSPEHLGDLDAFSGFVEDALARLVDSSWVSIETDEDGEKLYWAEDLAEDAIAWLRTRMGRNPTQLRAFEELDFAISERVEASLEDDDEEGEDDEEYADEPITHEVGPVN